MLLNKSIHKTVVLILFILVCKTIFSQKTTTEFGEFTAEEINLTQCEFDKDADAVVLLDKATSTYNDHYNLITTRRIRIKVLKEAGIERANIHIRYYSDDNFEFIRNIDATVLSYDEKKKPIRNRLDRKAVYSKKLNKYYSETSFALPNINVGSIFEYKYESQMKNYSGLREWVFQNDIPVILSSYNLTIVPNAEFAYSVYKSPFIPIVVKPNAQNGNVLFEMSNLPGLRAERYMGAANDYLQRVTFQFSGYKRIENDGYTTSVTSNTSYTNTWSKLAKELLDGRAFGTQLTKTLPGITADQMPWAEAGDPFAKMKLIHDYVKTHFSWNGIHSKFADDGLKGPWEKKTGTNGEINIILINLLKSAGLVVDPLLVSEREHGKVDTTYPYLDQFNKVVAAVTIEGKRYILDATDTETPSFMVPFNLLNTTGFVVNKKKPMLVTIKDDSRKNLSLVNLTATIARSGAVQMHALVDNYDYAKIENKEKYSQDKKAYAKDFFASYGGITVDSFDVSGAASDSLPLRHTADFSYALQKTGDYLLLTYNMFTGFETNPFIAEQRFSDIDFGCNYTCFLNGTFNLPENLTPEALPKNIKLVMPDKSMSVIRQVQQTGNTLQIGIRIEFFKNFYNVDAYPALQDFYKQMLEILKEPVVLKTKV